MPGKIFFKNVFIYKIDQSLLLDTLEGIYNMWTLSGSGSNTKGRLLKKVSFDNNICY